MVETTDALTLLETDHREVERLFTAFGSASDPARRRELMDDIIRELSVHAIVEEQLLYPMSRDAFAGATPLVEHSLDEHQEVKELLAELDRMDPQDPQFEQKAQALMSSVREHVAEEEGELFPGLREAVDADRLRTVGEAMAAAKALAPTKPHPHAPNTPPGNLLAGPPTAVLDKAREAAERIFGRRD